VAKHFVSFFFTKPEIELFDDFPVAKHYHFLRNKRENIYFCSYSFLVAKHLWQNILFYF